MHKRVTKVINLSSYQNFSWCYQKHDNNRKYRHHLHTSQKHVLSSLTYHTFWLILGFIACRNGLIFMYFFVCLIMLNENVLGRSVEKDRGEVRSGND